MRIFRYWMTVPLKTAFHSTYDIVPKREITDEAVGVFEAIVAAVKASGCEWEMHETSDKITSSSAQTDTGKHLCSA